MESCGHGSPFPRLPIKLGNAFCDRLSCISGADSLHQKTRVAGKIQTDGQLVEMEYVSVSMSRDDSFTFRLVFMF